MPIIPIDEINLLHSHVCQSIGEPKRIQILYALSEQPLNVNVLAQLLDTPQPTISRHLAILRQRSFVIAERSGTTITYSLADPFVITVLDSMRQILKGILERQNEAFHNHEE